MRNPAVNDAKANTPPAAGRTGGPPCAGRRSRVPWRRSGSAGCGAVALSPGQSRRLPRLPVCGPLNWSLRGYVQASSLDVWLLRRVPVTSGAACRSAVRGPGGPRPFAAADGHAAGARQRTGGGSRCLGHPPWQRVYRNGQMEHSAQVTVGLRGDVRGRAAIAGRERAHALDLGSATLGSKTCIQSNIFRFVMT